MQRNPIHFHQLHPNMEYRGLRGFLGNPKPNRKMPRKCPSLSICSVDYQLHRILAQLFGNWKSDRLQLKYFDIFKQLITYLN